MNSETTVSKTLETPPPLKRTLETPPKLPISSKRRSSALSFKSLQKQHTENTHKKDTISNPSNQSVEPFSFADFYVYWRKYIDILNKQGDKMLASILSATKPVLLDAYEVQLTYPNEMMLEEVKKHQLYILNYLRGKLKNYQIAFRLTLDEQDEQKFIYTPQEKYSRLREINPILDEFRKKLHLDV